MPLQEDPVIFEFTSPEELLCWQPINDAVMGGVSEGRIVQQSETTALFTGTVSLKYGGGFASIRASLGNRDLSACEGIFIRVRGDGKTYKLNVMDHPAFDGPQFQLQFRTVKGRWMEVSLPFGAMKPTLRGKALGDHGALRRGRVSSVGLMISDKQEGPFMLEIDWIKAYHPRRSTEEGGS